MHPDEIQDWAARYRRFAALECPQQPLYVAICEAIAADPELLALHADIPAAQARPNLLLAAVHERLLAGVAHPLADYYPSVGGQRRPDAALPGLLRDLLLGAQRPQIEGLLRSRATQTNEPGRCAVLRLALDAFVAASGQRRLALFDFGSSAGLNLGVDEDRVDCGGKVRGSGQRLLLRCDWRGGALPAAEDWQIVERLGVDLRPVDTSDSDAARWLQACVWPDDRERFARLGAALDWARQRRPRVEAQTDGLARLAQWLTVLPVGLQPVLFNSWVLAYFSGPEREAFHRRVLALVRERGLAWICAEDAACHPQPMPAPRAGATLWSLHHRAQSQAWAWSHAHGGWAEAI
jgi:hypothetical protein